MRYEFRCLSPKCGVISEVIQSLNDEPIKKCPKCKRGKVERIISLTAHPVVHGDIRTEHEKIKMEAKQTAQKIMNGDQKTIEDIYGTGAPSRVDLPKPKTLDQVKNGKIKRRG